MKKIYQFMVLLISIVVLVSYQNCSPGALTESSFNSYYDDDESSAFGTVFLTPNTPISVTPSTTSVTVTGRCSKGNTDSHRIDWKFIPGNGSTYQGNTSWNQILNACVNKYFTISIPIGSGFDYGSGNEIKLRYYLFMDDGEETYKDYYVSFTQGIIYEEARTSGSCDGTECDPCSGTISAGGTLESVTCELNQALEYSSAGFGGMALIFNVKRTGTPPSSNSAYYPLFHLYEIESSYYNGSTQPAPVFTYATGKFTGSTIDSLTWEHFFYYAGAFPYTSTVNTNQQSRTANYYEAVDDVSDDAEDWIWKSGVEYTVKVNYSYPQSMARNGMISLQVCLAEDTTTCTISTVNFSVPFASRQFGYNGLKLIFGTPSGVVPNSSLNFSNISGWQFSNVQWKLCETDTSSSGVFCNF